MKRITGLVLVRETGIGIPNLVVAVFDSDLAIEDIRQQEMSPQLMQRAGRRISSVLTDDQGAFSLPAEDLEFPGNEARPDLLLMVFAPEDVLDPRRPYPLPAEERALYISTVPRVDAGAEEAYVIRLLQKRLNDFQIPTGRAARDAFAAIRELADPIVRSLDIRDGLRSVLADRLEAERANNERARDVAKSKVERLSALPPSLRKQEARKDALVIIGKSRLGDETPSLQKKAISDGLARMKDISAQQKMRLKLTANDLKELNLEIDDGKISGRVPAGKLNATVRAWVNTLDLVRNRDPEMPNTEALQRKYLNADSNDEPTNPPIL